MTRFTVNNIPKVVGDYMWQLLTLVFMSNQISALDQEAQRRGNSVYFPGQVIPMLPEALSNDLCSLQPNVDRLCMVCEMIINPDGKIIRYHFYDAVMRSHARLTYTQVANMLNDEKFKNLYALYRALHTARTVRGALDFDTVDTRIVFGKGRKIKQIVPIIRNEAHRIIEECMLAANVCAAKFLLQKKIPALFRIHEGPDATKLADLRSFLGSFGLSLAGGEEPKTKDYANLLQ